MISRFFYPDLTKKILPVFSESGSQEFKLSHNFRSGYHMLEFSALIAEGNTECLLTFEGHNIEPISYLVNYQQGQVYKRIVCFSGVVGLTKIKINKKEIVINSFRMIKLKKSFAFKRMAQKLGKNWADVKKKILAGKVSQQHLLLAYNQLFTGNAIEQYKLWITYIEPGLTCAVKNLNADKIRKNVAPIGTLFCSVGYYISPESITFMENIFNKYPDLMVIYSDEDVTADSGDRLSPNFKSGWNMDLFVSKDYISGCCFVRCSYYEENYALFEKYGDRLALTILLLKSNGSNIYHMPLVLVHRFLDEVGLDKNFFQKRTAILSDFYSDEITLDSGEVEGSFRVTYPLPEAQPMVSLLVPTRDNVQFLKKCVNSILNKTSYLNFEIIIVDNQSREVGTLNWLSEIVQFSTVRVISYDLDFNYSAINNFAVRQAKGSIIALINNDIEVISPGWLSEMVSHACRPEIGCVGAKLYYSDGRIQHAGIILSEHNIAMHGHRYFDRNADGYQGRLKLVQNYSAVTGACLVVRKEIYEQVGGLDEENLAIAYNDVDFCLKVCKAGYRNLWTPYAELYHHESVSRGYDDTPKKRKRLKKEAAYMRKKWGKELASDPCYNPNLTPLKEDFSVRVF